MTEHDPSNVYNNYPEGIGETPGPIGKEVVQWNARVKSSRDLSIQVGRFGLLRKTIKEYTSRGLSVGVSFAGPKYVRMIIAEHPDLIKRTAAAAIGVAGAAIGGVIYMHERHKPKK